MKYENKTEKYVLLESRMKKLVRPISAGLAGVVMGCTVGCANIRPSVRTFDRGDGKAQIVAGFSMGADNEIEYIEDRQGNQYVLEEKTFWTSRTGRVLKYTLAIAGGIAVGYLAKDAFDKKSSHSDSPKNKPAPTQTTQPASSSSSDSSDESSSNTSGGSTGGDTGGNTGGNTGGDTGGNTGGDSGDSGGYTPGGGETD